MTTREFLDSLPDSQAEIKREYFSHMSGCIVQDVFHKACPRGSFKCIDCILCSYR